MKSFALIILSLFLILSLNSYEIVNNEPDEKSGEPEISMSTETEECISCHEYINSGLVSSWKNSLHAKNSPEIGKREGCNFAKATIRGNCSS